MVEQTHHTPTAGKFNSLSLESHQFCQSEASKITFRKSKRILPFVETFRTRCFQKVHLHFLVFPLVGFKAAFRAAWSFLFLKSFVRKGSSAINGKKKIQHKGRITFKDHVSSYFAEYCGATSIHGVQYLGERKRFLIERIVWLVIIIVVWYFCISLITKAYNKWQTSPVVVTFATTETPIWEIPFPAITICPEAKTDPTILNYTQLFLKKFNNNTTPEEEFRLEALLLICDKLGYTELLPNMNDTKIIEDEALLIIFTSFLSMLTNDSYYLKWLGRALDDDTTSITLTEEGMCFSFNMLNINEIFRDPEKFMMFSISEVTKPSNWTLEHGFSDDESIDTYPKRTFVSGISGGASFVLYTNHSHEDFMCGDALQGFKVVLHHPSELPDLNKHVRLPLDEAVNIGIKPKMIKVSDELKFYTPQDRNCYFPDQRPLLYYKYYSQNNCFAECLSNMTLRKCGCIPFYMPKNTDSPNCGLGSQTCVDDSRLAIGINEVEKKKSKHCDCLPSCTSLEYDVEISQCNWNWKKTVVTLRERFSIPVSLDKLNYEKDHLSWLSVYYKELQFLPSERHELYGYVDFFSNTGGLLGLFIGFSVTSGIEIIYFLTLRLACNIKKYGIGLWSGDVQLETKAAAQVV